MRSLATKEDLKAYATKEDLEAFATKDELNGGLADVRQEMRELFSEAKRNAARLNGDQADTNLTLP